MAKQNTTGGDSTSVAAEYHRRGFLGGLTGLLAAAYTMSVPETVAATISNEDDTDTQTISSPDGRIRVTIDVADGVPSYTVTYDGEIYITSSTLGFDFQNQPSFGVAADGTIGTELTVTGSETETTTETWEPVWGQFATVSEPYTVLRLGLVETRQPGRTANLELRVFNDGLGFRVVLSDDFASNGGNTVISSENTQFNFADDYTAWWIKNEMVNPRFEQEYETTPLSGVSSGTRTIRPNDNTLRNGAHTPLTLEASDDAYLSIHEAALTDYATMSLAPQSDDGGTEFAVELAPLPDGTKVSSTPPIMTPWRTVQLGDRPGDLVESSLIALLNDDLEKSVLPTVDGKPDTDWITPRKYIGIWWTMIAGNANWEYKSDVDIEDSGGNPAAYIHGARTERMKRYMKFASENGIDSVLVEGWNQGWDSYPGSGVSMDFDTTYPDFDIKETTEYGQSLTPSVEMTAHNETAGNLINYEEQIQNGGIFEFYEDNHIRSIKNGYVSDPGMGHTGDGGTATMNHHCQIAVNHHELVARAAAANRQLLERHEADKPTGKRRTYPNLASTETVKAQEYDGFGALASDVGRAHHVTLPFTRMLAGPASYQPGIFDITFNDETGGQIQTTRAKQLAMYPSYNAGLQMAADRVEAYIDEQFAVGEYVQAASGVFDGMITADEWRGAFGTTYVPIDPNREPSGSSVSFVVSNVPSAGMYDLHLRYASAPEDNSQRVIDAGGPQATLVVGEGDAATTKSITPDFTTSWDDWQLFTTQIDLQQGENIVAIELNYDDSEGFTGDVGGFNLNTIGVTQPGVGAPFPAGYTDLATDHIENENASPKSAFEFIESVPAGGWDDTTVIDAEIGDYTVIARKKGKEWYVGAMTGADGQAIDVPMDFLGSGNSNSEGHGPRGPKYVAEIYTDGVGGGVDADPETVHTATVLIDPSKTVLASMARSGGTAIHLRPARGREIHELPEYERPTQDLAVTIETEPSFNEPFITATGSNDGNFIGGRTVDIAVDGTVVATDNVRLSPNATDETFEFGYTIASWGTHDVVVRDADDDRILASATVTVRPGDLIAEFSDPTGDDNGPGEYIYPTNSAFRAGAFDLRSFVVYESETAYRFVFEVANLYDVFGGEFSPHYFVVYLSASDQSGGQTTELGDLNVRTEFETGWQYRIAASGFAQSVVDKNGTDLGTPDTLVDFDRNMVVVSVEKQTLSNVDIGTLSVAPIVGSEEHGAFRRIQEHAGSYAFGGAKKGAVENAPRILDLLTSEGIEQVDALDYDAEQLATVPFVSL